MSDMRFDVPGDEYQPRSMQEKKADWIDRLVALGIARDRSQAELIAAGFVIAVLVVVFIIYRLFISGDSGAPALLPQ